MAITLFFIFWLRAVNLKFGCCCGCVLGKKTTNHTCPRFFFQVCVCIYVCFE